MVQPGLGGGLRRWAGLRLWPVSRSWPDSRAFASTVPQDVPGLHVRQRILDAGADPLMDRVQLVLPPSKRRPLPGLRYGMITSGVTPDTRRPRSRVHPRSAGQHRILDRRGSRCGCPHRGLDRDTQAGVGVDDDLHVHRVSIVLAGRGHAAVVGGTSVPSTIGTVSALCDPVTAGAPAAVRRASRQEPVESIPRTPEARYSRLYLQSRVDDETLRSAQ